jgi:hypothetical protein
MNKKLIFGISGGVLACLAMVIAAVYYSSIPVTIQVNEALSTTTTSCAIGGMPSETHYCYFNVTNDAVNPLYTRLSWTEDVNDDGVTYTNDMPKEINLSTGLNELSVSYKIADDSAIGLFNGTITLERIATP